MPNILPSGERVAKAVVAGKSTFGSDKRKRAKQFNYTLKKGEHEKPLYLQTLNIYLKHLKPRIL